MKLDFKAKSSISALAFILLSGCQGFVGSTGPDAQKIIEAPQATASVQGMVLLNLASGVKHQLQSRERVSFAEVMGGGQPIGQLVRPGDVLDVTIWEAPPAALFTAGGDIRVPNAGTQTSRQVSLPPALIDGDGRLFVPYAGYIMAAGRTPEDIQREIVRRLAGKAHMPQAIVRIARNATANVTVVGEVASSTRMELTPKGERLLDALAQAGGTRQPAGKMTIQLTRGGQVVTMPLSAVIDDPRQNVILATNDVVTAIYQPFSFTVLGEAGRNEEINFEATGFKLSQALGRIGGVQGARANARGLFVFRWEPADAVPVVTGTLRRADGMVPVIYRIDLKDPATFFLAQNFEMRNRDIIYVATAPAAEFQQFVNLVASTVLPIVGVVNTVP